MSERGKNESKRSKADASWDKNKARRVIREGANTSKMTDACFVFFQ